MLEELNEQQLEAVKEVSRPILILAGAGSGKTKTITNRLAYLISEVGIDPASTLTLTFTNKAATQMRDRALALLNKNNLVYPPLLCTFHKFGLLFLKFHIDKLGRKANFVVIDTDDKKRILKNLSTELPTSLVASEISRYKNSFLTPDDAALQAEQKNYKLIAKMYKEYEDYLVQNNLVDFDDLLALTYKILDENPKLCEEISNRYQYIMIDEYQDTNDLQYKLLVKLCQTHENICVVGDDDQSIYGWRGANIRNILDFSENFPNAKVVKLEKNYRSTKQILHAANELIEYNRGRMGKVLESTKGDGKEIELIEANDEAQEAGIIASRVKKLLKNGANPKEIAILYRINALSRSLEEGLNKEGISYKMVGGVKFYERAEIKDLISYLRLIANPHDDFSLRRVINRPKRGIGKVTVDKILKSAYEDRVSMYDYLVKNEDILEKIMSKKAKKEVDKFIVTLNSLQEQASSAIYSLIDELEEGFGIKKYYSELPDSLERTSNIDEFYGLFRDHIKQNPQISVDDFLNELALQSDQDQIDENSITIMSVHASKGLEFDHLFVMGLEEGFFPLIGDGSDIEEERRLGYVAITRAKEELTLSTSSSRFYKGRRTELSKSRFLKEAGICEGSLTLEKTTSFKKGDLVKHKIFGIGRVLEVSKAGKEFKLKINFGGSRRDILASFVEKV
ncbi:MAG: UvrD-helicase domain-containing protein [Sulfurospirillaceae bacterium]|jgi:DNA helicase-2/ATP-dependent DNA helicase PcrA|nr:UvrD-helicase domain-containing protein [Sulfurospirillaceae bacterium]MCK9545381.1 UvrD-helicase domain-containing protein [Sulfurospirillaceae bacterium]MDY0237549.1 3'-5' exonuclease [Campylobacterales bacterium]NLM98706.1 UvrD-helicase domain-containing protein [Campylobacteraceae bacterium]